MLHSRGPAPDHVTAYCHGHHANSSAVPRAGRAAEDEGGCVPPPHAAWGAGGRHAGVGLATSGESQTGLRADQIRRRRDQGPVSRLGPGYQGDPLSVPSSGSLPLSVTAAEHGAYSWQSINPCTTAPMLIRTIRQCEAKSAKSTSSRPNRQRDFPLAVAFSISGLMWRSLTLRPMVSR